MPKKKKTVKKEYELLALKITDYKARVDGSINYEVRDSRHQYHETKIYRCSSDIEVEAVCTFPDERAKEAYTITVYGHETEEGMFQSTLSDFQVYDENRVPKYRKVRGEQRPVFEPPNGVGFIERLRGTKDWSGCCWLPPQIVSDMLVLLANVTPLYFSIHELKMGRQRWIAGLTLQTTDPAEE